MSHFTCIVIGENPEEQLKPFGEDLEIDPYVRGLVSDKEKEEFLQYYQKKGINSLQFDSLYRKYGEDWNGASWKKNKDGVWQDWSTRNPNSKWDWYLLGGRWSGQIKLKDGATSGVSGKSGVFNNEVGIDQSLKKDISNLDELISFAILKNGEWYEKGKMGWFAMVTDPMEQEVWDEFVLKTLNELPDETLISVYDLHI